MTLVAFFIHFTRVDYNSSTVTSISRW